jgi:DNA-directed RNA polymerase specialized sigma24 family protein
MRQPVGVTAVGNGQMAWCRGVDRGVGANFLVSRDDLVDMGDSVSDAQVLAASVDDPVRFAVLWECHADRVRRYLARWIGGDLAEDLTGEVFVRAFRARGSYRPLGDSALPWLLGIASHLVADHRRAERRRFEALSRLASENCSFRRDSLAVE